MDAWTLLILAWSGLGVAGSVWMSIGLKLKACPLCFYQRTFVMGVFAIYLMAWMASVSPSSASAQLALPLALAGFVVALFHESLVLRRVLECPRGFGGQGTAPFQSVLMFTGLLVLILGHGFGLGLDQAAPLVLGTGLILGLVLGVLSIISSPPLPPVPTQPYAEPLTICRPPYVPARETV
ncbi:MAG TPA: disulfide bond formation protein B [Gemmatales bacterium]|nr:disulfide bond formation protein B [Gemmatales bacterium]HMP58822.1 disulfide bond formation protein B [Gemmatales bacterium]